MSEDDEHIVAERVKALERRRRVADLLLHEHRLKEELDKLVLSADTQQACGHSLSRGTGRHCHRHHRSSSSTSSDRTASREHRKRRKWSIRKFTEEKKKMKKLNLFELFRASCLWFLDFQDTNDTSAT